MGSAKYFISINLHSGYWQCHIADEDIPKTTFFTKYDLYKWVVMPMGLTNTPVTLMQTMNNLFPNMLDSSVAMFLDDILVYSHMVKEYFTLLEKVLVHLFQCIFYCKPKKCSFLPNKTVFHGFDVMPEGMYIRFKGRKFE